MRVGILKGVRAQGSGYRVQKYLTPNTQHPRRGFTLIELLVVIIIIAVMAGTIIPAYARLRAKTLFQNDVGKVRDIFAFARQKAVEQDTEATVSFMGQNQSFVAEVDAPPQSKDLPVALASEADSSQNGNSDRSKSCKLIETVMVTGFRVDGNSRGRSQTRNSTQSGIGNGNMVRFRGDGTCSAAEWTMISEDGYKTRFTLAPATGLVTTEDE